MSSIGATMSTHSPLTAAAGEHDEVTTSVSPTDAWPTHEVSLPRMNLNAEGLIETDPRTQIAVSYEPVDMGYGSQAPQCPLPALSLIKLYIGQYVLKHDTTDDAERVKKMISRSDDDLAVGFYRKCPESVDSIATEYGLFSTFGGEKWEVSRTTVGDVVSFISQLRLEHPDSEVLEAMRHWSPVAADGYRQNFGLTGLPSSEDTKTGWSDRRSWHSSVVFDPGYVMAAITEGGKYAHTEDIAEGIADIKYQDLVKPTQKTGRKTTLETPKAHAVSTGL